MHNLLSDGEISELPDIKDINNSDNVYLDVNLDCLDFVPSPVLVQRNGIIIYVNEEFRKLLHVDNQSVLGKSLLELLNIKESLEITDGEYKIKDFQSREIDIEVRCNSRVLGGMDYKFITLRDVTKERREFNEIREKAEIYSDIFQRLPVSMFITINGLFEEINKEGLWLLGEDNINEVKGRSLLAYADPEELNFIKNRKQILYDKKQPVKFEEQKIVRKNGEKLTIESASFPFTIKGHNGVVTTIRDITERKNLETDLRESRLLYKRLIDILPDGISIHDGVTYSFVSNSYGKMLGYDDPKELLGKTIDQIISKEDHGIMKHRIETILSEDKVSPAVEYQFTTKQGEIIDVESTSVRLWDNNKFNILSSIRDITEKKKIEESRLMLERAMESEKLKTEFFSNMSHELRTPLNILLSSLQLINMYIGCEDTVNMASIRKYTGIMKQNCYRLLRLIDNLLDITKIDSGFYKLNMSNRDIVKIVEDITQSVAEFIKEKDIKVIFDTDIEEKIIGCDADKIERVILNLLSNSIKFTKPGGTIQVNISDASEGLKISVRDTGSGIPRDKLNSIFDRFAQVDKSLSRRSEGTGIGLALVKSLVEMHGGTICAASEYGEYTQFDIVLPVELVSNEEKFCFEHVAANNDLDDKKVERMSVEFSDIYL
jgi:PAS domain S-box-containing protein